jgi:hypothetical protein
MSAIFISHSSADDSLAFEVAAHLGELGHRSVFLDFDPAQASLPVEIGSRSFTCGCAPARL